MEDSETGAAGRPKRKGAGKRRSFYGDDDDDEAVGTGGVLPAESTSGSGLAKAGRKRKQPEESEIGEASRPKSKGAGKRLRKLDEEEEEEEEEEEGVGSGASGPPSAHAQALVAAGSAAAAPIAATTRDRFDDAAAAAFKQEGRVCATDAKHWFALSDTDLSGLTPTVKRNPYYRSAAPMRLYDVVDLIARCSKKYNNEDGLAAKLRKNAAAAVKRAATKATRLASSSYSAGGLPLEDHDNDDYADDQSESQGIPCPGGGGNCGGTAARSCLNEMCCYCCKIQDAGSRLCSRHN